MELQNIKFRSTLFTDKDIIMDEQWFAEANRLMSELNLVPSVGSAFKIVPNPDGGTPTINDSYFIEFKKLDNSFKISLMPNRFDVEKSISSPSISSPLNEFVDDAIGIFDRIDSLQNTFSRAALAVNIGLSISDKERETITNEEFHISPDDVSISPTEFFKRTVFQTQYLLGDKENNYVDMNEVIELTSPNISDHNSHISVGFDFNSSQNNSVEEISKHFRHILKAAAKKIARCSESSGLSKILFN